MTRLRVPPVTLAAQTTVLVLSVPIAYVLSAPPAFWVLDKAGFSIFDTDRNWVYLPWVPAIWLEQNVPPIKAFYEWYCDIWF